MRWRPNTIASRIAFTAILGLVLFQLVNFVLVYVERVTVVEAELPLPDRVAAITEVIDAVPAAERPHILAGIHGPLQVRIADRPPAPAAVDRYADIEPLRRRLRVLLGNRPYQVLFLKRAQDASGANAGPETSVEVRLSDGSWLIFAMPNRFVVRLSLKQLAVRLGLLTLVIGLLSMIAARRLARPIADFALAAERLGVDTNAPPLAERGPRELRAATAPSTACRSACAASSPTAPRCWRRCPMICARRSRGCACAPSSSTIPSCSARCWPISTR